jgi:hypothetical protein
VSPARAGLHLASPLPPDQLAAFPDRSYRPGTEVFRSHSHQHGPWWFSSSRHGRFDLASPDGTCYAAESEVVSLLETWGGIQVVPDYLVAQRDMSKLRLNGVRVADMTSNAAIRFGVTAEVFTTSDYAMTQLWSTALHQAGFGGIRYWARHDLAHTAACLALFGPAGAAADVPGLATTNTDHLPNRGDLLSALENQTGITVVPVPPI